MRVLLLLLISIPAWTQPPKPGSVEGTVFNSATGAPIADATFTLTNPRKGIRYIAVSDSSGRFAFPRVEPTKEYAIAVTAPGFVVLPAILRQALREFPPIAVGEDQHVRLAPLRLTPMGVVTGRVVDEDGDPVPDVAVEAFEYHFTARGRELVLARGESTDDRGVYRVTGLTPGKYMLHAYSHPKPPQFSLPAEHTHSTIPEEGFAAVDYPDAIAVPPGQEVTGINFKLKRVPLFHVRGKFSGTLPDKLWLEPAPCERGTHITVTETEVKRDGAFDFKYILPGSYCFVPRPPVAFAPIDLTVTVKDRDLNGIELTSIANTDIAGKIEVEGSAKMPDEVELGLRDGGQWVYARAKADATFVFKGVQPGTFELSVRAAAVYVKSIRYGDRDATDGIIPITAAGGNLSIILAGDMGTITGTVLDADDKPAENVIVFLVPKEHGMLAFRKTDVGGNFRISNVAPGEYRALALETEIEARSPELLKAFGSRVAEAKLEPSGTATVRLKLITADEIEEAKWK
jgi:hypothetical protein